jgi:ornithine cyclodeaminase
LYSATTGEPLAQMDGNEITSRRTAAASALAASRLANPAARVHLIIGAGRVGRLLPKAYSAVLPIEEFVVWDQNLAAADALATSLREVGYRASVADRLADAASRADVISCATLATAPVVLGRWLPRGNHLDLIGSFTPAMREADSDCFAGANVWIDTHEALLKSGDLLQAIQEGTLAQSEVCGTLEQLCRIGGHHHSPADRTVFKSVGTALEDLAAAILVYESV